MLHTNFVEIGPPVPEKKIYEGSLAYMGVAAILVWFILSCSGLGKKELICLLQFTCNYSSERFLCLLIFINFCVISLCHSLGLQYNY